MSYQSHHFIQFATYFPIYRQPAIVLGGWNLGIPLSPDICLLFILMSCRVLLLPYPTLLYAPATTPAQAHCLLRNCYDRYPILLPQKVPKSQPILPIPGPTNGASLIAHWAPSSPSCYSSNRTTHFYSLSCVLHLSLLPGVLVFLPYTLRFIIHTRSFTKQVLILIPNRHENLQHFSFFFSLSFILFWCMCATGLIPARQAFYHLSYTSILVF
jgi:hypothetical protein